MADETKAVQGGATDAPQPLLPEDQEARVRLYVRRLIGTGVTIGVLLIAGAVMLRDAFQGIDYVVGIALVALGVGNAGLAWIRYRQLCRYLRTGSGSKYEDLVKAAESGSKSPDS